MQCIKGTLQLIFNSNIVCPLCLSSWYESGMLYHGMGFQVTEFHRLKCERPLQLHRMCIHLGPLIKIREPLRQVGHLDIYLLGIHICAAISSVFPTNVPIESFHQYLLSSSPGPYLFLT
jgi:hypothetical protein